MRKLLIILALLWAIPAYAGAPEVNSVANSVEINGVANPVEVSGVAGAGGLTCKISPGTETGGGWTQTNTGDVWANNASASQYVQNAVSVSLCKIEVYIKADADGRAATWKICDTDCTTNCTTADSQPETVNGAYAWYTVTWTTPVVKTGDFSICQTVGSGTISWKMHSSSAAYFGTSTAGKNQKHNGLDYALDYAMNIWYLQP